MHRLKQFKSYKNHLVERYIDLVEKSNNYQFIDEAISDLAAFKTLKLLEKINQISYLDRKLTV